MDHLRFNLDLRGLDVWADDPVLNTDRDQMEYEERVADDLMTKYLEMKAQRDRALQELSEARLIIRGMLNAIWDRRGNG